MHPKVGIFFRALADFFLPRRCVVCGRVLSLQEKYICLLMFSVNNFCDPYPLFIGDFAVSSPLIGFRQKLLSRPE